MIFVAGLVVGVAVERVVCNKPEIQAVDALSMRGANVSVIGATSAV
jgi:hypothetical protein